jgi:anthraniloyl-CoA monooxygenase
VRIDVLGGGPAGLYFAILMKKADPGHEIRVFERNAPDATFGFGVVFSEGSLGELEDADYESYLRITESFARWDPLDVRYRGTTTRVRGNAYSGIERKQLLRILQERARGLGVELTFHHEITSLEPHLDADLVVGADGANSLTRRTYADLLGASVEPHPSKYAWFGADFALPVFTYVFRETPWGLFQAHCYPYDRRRSTMVVLVSESTWRRAGLDAMDEEASLAFTQAVFQEDLGPGRRMISNRSLWISFPWISCRSWHHGHVVLLGDAAHTAHFSVGAGTRLAMEDAIALARALVKWKGNREAALAEYELERQPAVERMQEAARVSAAYFDSLERYLGFEPLQFTYQLMTRTPRITHHNLTLRDPEFVRRVEARFWARATGGEVAGVPEARPERPLVAPPPGFAPLRLRSLTLPNRIALAPVEDWRPAVTSGAGLVLTPLVAVSPEGRVSPETPLVGDLPPAPAEALVVPSIGHAGRRGATRPRRLGVDRPLPAAEGWPLVSASAIAYAPWMPVPAELDAAGMERIVGAFAAAARRLRRLGYRALELDLSRGSLLASFLSPLSNHRTDEHGGSLEGRLRFPLRVLEAVRAEWPDDLPLAVALTVSDLAPGGITEEEALEAVRRLAGAGADLFRVLVGQTTSEFRPDYGRLYGAANSDLVRNRCHVPTVASGRITTLDELHTVVAAGRADLCVLDLG